MFLIAEGRVGISVHGETGTSQKVATLERGAAFGEISLLTGEPRLATVRAIDRVGPGRDRQVHDRSDPARPTRRSSRSST